MRHSEDGEAGGLDLGVFVFAADEGDGLACRGRHRGWRRWGIGCGRRDGWQQLQLILEILFQLWKAGQQAFDGLLLAGWIAVVGEELLDPVACVEHVELRVAEDAIVEGVGKAGVEVDEATDLFGMAAADRAQLFASDRVSGEDRLLQVEGVDDRKNIVAETVRGVIVAVGSGGAGVAETAAGDAVDVALAGEFRRKLVEDMRGVAQTGEEDEWASGAPPNRGLQA